MIDDIVGLVIEGALELLFAGDTTSSSETISDNEGNVDTNSLENTEFLEPETFEVTSQEEVHIEEQGPRLSLKPNRHN